MLTPCSSIRSVALDDGQNQMRGVRGIMGDPVDGLHEIAVFHADILPLNMLERFTEDDLRDVHHLSGK